VTNEEKIKDLELRVSLYERPGGVALFYALNRKMNEIASLLNAINLKSIDMAVKSDASFERVFKLLEKSEGISTAAKALESSAGITGDETKDTQSPVFRITPESMAQKLGDYKTQEA